MAGRVLFYQRRGIGTGEDEQFYRNLFDAAPCALLSIGTNRRILSANRRAVQFLGCRPDAIIGRLVLDFFSPGPAGKALAREIFRGFRIGYEISGRELEMLSTGTLVRVRLFAQPIQDMEARIVASCSMVQQVGALHLVDHKPTDYGEEISSKLISVPDESRRIERHVKQLLVKSMGCAFLVNVNEIDWFGAAGNYVEVHVGSRSYLLRRTMKDVEGRLDSSKFLRIHRATIVNTGRIKEFRVRSWGDYDVILHDGVRLTLSRAYRKKLLWFLRNDLRLRPLATSASRAWSSIGL